MLYFPCLVFPPVIEDSPLDQGVLVGSDTTFNCSATSLDGVVIITWSALDSQGVALPLPVPREVVVGGIVISSLDLSSVVDEDAGTYTCTVSNRLSPGEQREASLNFSVISKSEFSLLSLMIYPSLSPPLSLLPLLLLPPSPLFPSPKLSMVLRMCWLLWDWMLPYSAMPLVIPPSLTCGRGREGGASPMYPAWMVWKQTHCPSLMSPLTMPPTTPALSLYSTAS